MKFVEFWKIVKNETPARTFNRIIEFCKAVGNLTLAQVFAFFSRKKD